MAFEYKRQNWMAYGRKAKSMNLGIKDNNGQTIESIELEKGKDIDNMRKLRRIQKYGFKLGILEEYEEQKEDSLEEEKEKEIDWLGKDFSKRPPTY